MLNYDITTTDSGWTLSAHFTSNKPIDEVWDFLATTDGFKNWFYQLSIQDGKLHFDMDDFHEEMEMIEYRKPEVIHFEWDKADVKFELSEDAEATQVNFTERMASDFDNPKNDFAGWLTHLNRLNDMLNDREPEEIDVLVPRLEKEVESKL